LDCARRRDTWRHCATRRPYSSGGEVVKGGAAHLDCEQLSGRDRRFPCKAKQPVEVATALGRMGTPGDTTSARPIGIIGAIASAWLRKAARAAVTVERPDEAEPTS